ncbi:MAG: hypothetical protein H0X17_14310 [Deltaproteobacteria bacterium]|nr:hypothetical protein [Deltaproteobacteria bacterium]
MQERPRNTPVRIAIVVFAFAGLLNLAFYFLAQSYFEDRARRFGPDELAFVNGARAAFLMFSGVVSLGTVSALLAPRWVGHIVPAVVGLTSLYMSYASWTRDLQPTLVITLATMGVLLPVVTWLSFQKSRAAWSFLVALCTVLGLILIFGAPKLRGLMGIGLWHALILPGLLAVGAIGLVMVRADYRDDYREA